MTLHTRFDISILLLFSPCWLTSAAKSGKNNSSKLFEDDSKTSHAELEGFWSGIDTSDGSSISLSITCNTGDKECEVIYSDNYWSEDLCGGMGVVIQTYNISEGGNLQANKNGPIVCANGKGFDGYPDFNEFVVESNGSLLWSLNQQRFWKTSC